MDMRPLRRALRVLLKLPDALARSVQRAPSLEQVQYRAIVLGFAVRAHGESSRSLVASELHAGDTLVATPTDCDDHVVLRDQRCAWPALRVEEDDHGALP